MTKTFEEQLEDKEKWYYRLRNLPETVLMGRKASDVYGTWIYVKAVRQANGKYKASARFEDRTKNVQETFLGAKEYDDPYEVLLRQFEKLPKLGARFETFERDANKKIVGVVFSRPQQVQNIDDAVKRFLGQR